MTRSLEVRDWRRALRGYALCLLSLAVTGPAAAESGQQMLFNRLGSAEGLSQGGVMAVAQDASGFLWLATEDGLNRYDGEDLRHYIRDRNDPKSLPNNWVSALALDGDGRLWIGTDGGGLVFREPGGNEFKVPADRAGRSLVDPQGRIRVIRPAGRGQLWIGTRKTGLKLLDLEAGTAREYRHDPTDPSSISDDSLFAVAPDPSGSVWIGTQRGLDRVDAATGQALRFGDQLRDLLGVTGELRVEALHLDVRGALWIGTNRGLARLDTPSGSLQGFRSRPGERASLADDRINAIFEDDEQRLWIGTQGGLSLLDRRSERFTTFRHDPSDPASLPDDNVVELFQDRGGLLWVGTKTGGAASWNPRSWSFGHRRLGVPGGDNVAAFAEDGRGTVWIGSFGGGLSALDRQTGRIRTWTRRAGHPQALGDDFVMALVADDRDRIWYGTMNAGVERLDPATGQIKRFTHRPGDKSSLGAAGVMSLLRDSRGRIWVGTYGAGLCRIDPATDAVACYPVQRGDGPGLSSDRATALAEDRAGLIWVGTDGGGLNVLDPDSGRIAQFRHAQDDAQSLSANTIYSLHVDERGQLWVGTRGGGLDRFIGAPFGSQPPTFENFSELHGLPNSTIYGIESDSSGALWLSTNRGLARFDPVSGAVRVFRRSHGLQADEFNFGAHFRSRSGELFFGGAGGFNAFSPARLRFNDRPPPVVLTGFLKFNQPANTAVPPEKLEAVSLDYQDDVITFRFAALDFAAPAENRYTYMLEGFDKDWVEAGNDRQATYTNLDGGRYVFRVRAANSDGAWNETGIALPVNADKPPWLRWWAYLSYAVLLALVLYAVWEAQQRKLLREAAYARRLEQEVAQRTEELAERNDELQLANDRLLEASLTDPLTGLGNRRCLREVVTERLAKAAPGHPSFVLMIVDLDHLKPINDQHGHEGGDRVLIGIAEILRHLCRASDRIVRWGGDEFVVLCEAADIDSAAVLAERIRATVSKQIFRVGEGVVARSSCSIGFATYPFVPGAPGQLDWEQSLALADMALYEAKGQRNTWVGWSGNAAAAERPALMEEIARDADQLESAGAIRVRRRPTPRAEDATDVFRALTGPSER
jgi:diguanylate cyclase (GGDEF)-like protein